MPEKVESPLGSPPPPERATATWGSNLIAVGDPPVPEGMSFALPEGTASLFDTPTLERTISVPAAPPIQQSTPIQSPTTPTEQLSAYR